MEDFNNFETKYTNAPLPTALELKEIKQRLLSGDRNKILQSLERIKLSMNSEEAVSEILKSDISEFLCDAVMPLDSTIVCSLYSCIEEMASHPQFFTYSHSCFTTESLIRTLNFLMKDSGNLTSINQCLHLLNYILKGHVMYHEKPDNKTTENIIHLLPSLVKNLPPTASNKYYIGSLVLSLMELDVPKQNQDIFEMTFSIFHSWFNLLTEILEAKHPLKEKLILLTSALCHLALRYLFSNDNSFEELRFEINENLRKKIVENICEFLISVAAPYYQSASFSVTEDNSISLGNFYQTLLCFCDGVPTPEKNRLFHGLGESGFLQFTTKIISFCEFSQNQKLRGLCVLVLFYMILYLAEDVFSFPDVWLEGREDFRSKVQQGIAQLPANSTEWLSVLVNTQYDFEAKLVLLLYLYFYSITAKSQDMLSKYIEPVYPTIVSFIRETNGFQSSNLVMKLVWFVFVMSQLSISQTLTHEDEIGATNDMVSLLETYGDLSLVYTHHPALLYWVFTVKVSSNIQTQTVNLWLKNKSTGCKELEELMKESPDVRFAILDVLQNGWGQELDSAFASLRNLILDSNTGEDLTVNLWFSLPQVLAKFTADSTSVTNVDYIIELCSLRAPEATDGFRNIRIATLLPDVFLQSNLISIVPCLSLMYQLLKTGVDLEDHRVLWVVMRHKNFIHKVLNSLSGNVSEASVLSLKIITLLWKEAKEIKYSEAIQRICIKKEVICEILETDSESVLLEAVQFLQQILLTKFESSLFEIKDLDQGFLEVLFLNIQDIIVKSETAVCNYCWLCLKLLIVLEPFENQQNVKELVTNPLLCELVVFYLPQLKESPQFKEFLVAWIDSYNLNVNDPCFQRKLYGDFFKETIKKIVLKSKEDFNYENQNDVLAEKILVNFPDFSIGIQNFDTVEQNQAL